MLFLFCFVAMVMQPRASRRTFLFFYFFSASTKKKPKRMIIIKVKVKKDCSYAIFTTFAMIKVDDYYASTTDYYVGDKLKSITFTNAV